MTRAAFSAAMPPEALFDGAREIRAVGLSLNYICQQLADQRTRELIEAGATMQCLFLDPSSDAMRAREAEEGHVHGHLATLTELNIGTLTRLVGDRLSEAARDRLQIAGLRTDRPLQCHGRLTTRPALYSRLICQPAAASRGRPS